MTKGKDQAEANLCELTGRDINTNEEPLMLKPPLP